MSKTATANSHPNRQIPPAAPEDAPAILRRRHQLGEVGLWVEMRGSEGEITAIRIDTDDGELEGLGELAAAGSLAADAERQLEDYCARGKPLELPLADHRDRPSQAAAMDFLAAIPRGETRTYAQQATAVRAATGTGFGPRNAGSANRANHFPLAIPCHRIVRSDGDVGGFMGSGREAARRLKSALLRHERGSPG